MLNDIKKDAQERMAKSIDALKHTLTSIRTGRASPALLERVVVNAYGASTPLNQVATITNADAHSLLVTPFDKSMVKEIEKGLYNAEFTPNTLGTSIRINMPPPTEERRKELAKQVKGEGEGSKVAIRNIRQDANKAIAALLKDKAISEDEKKRGEDDIQKLTDKAIKDVDSVVADKEKELMQV
ncbi:ribosome recycling factor [Stenotrophomonas oahuensis]|uniref:Ribosome-recycling factor n=1 Tax=Stenotrophomonas oahuensis TaxID=3003271 RepID=A0ABY9YKN6_9GAMM|nr:ribosome recycling factor [Stenotrophomonas sp. A5586]WNH51445.1 ribosome recycling factor [Stenotrophomonas sp. A5586]